MIRYHGTPITPNDAARAILTARHGMVSFAHPQQLALVAEVCQSFVIDNGAYSVWRAGNGAVDVAKYLDFVNQWKQHPGFDWCIIPDKIDGDESDNQKLIESWPMPSHQSVPVWHLHESLDFLEWMIGRFHRVAFGSSGEFADPGTEQWWIRIGEAAKVVCDEAGRPTVKIHMLRGMDATLFSQFPFSSVDSCGVARNIGIDAKWETGYLRGMSKALRAQVIADRFERHAAASIWEARTELFAWGLLG